jgi:hypothetical protein
MLNLDEEEDEESEEIEEEEDDGEMLNLDEEEDEESEEIEEEEEEELLEEVKEEKKKRLKKEAKQKKTIPATVNVNETINVNETVMNNISELILVVLKDGFQKINENLNKIFVNAGEKTSIEKSIDNKIQKVEKNIVKAPPKPKDKWDSYQTVQGQIYSAIRDKETKAKQEQGINFYKLTELSGHAYELFDKLAESGIDNKFEIQAKAEKELNKILKQEKFKGVPEEIVEKVFPSWAKYSNLSPFKKGPGKPKQKEVNKEENGSEDENLPKKRGRGRPRKNS